MPRLILLASLVALPACVSTDAYTGNQICARTAGCVSSFADPGYGPIQAQAVAPVSAGPAAWRIQPNSSRP